MSSTAKAKPNMRTMMISIVVEAPRCKDFDRACVMDCMLNYINGPLPQLMEEAHQYLASIPPPAHRRGHHAIGSNNETKDNEEAEDYQEEWDHSPQNDRVIGPGCFAKESEIRSFYEKPYDNDNTDDKIVFVLRLALGLLATGHCTVDVETTVLKAAAALRLPTPRLSVGHRLLQAQFGSAPPHFLTCKRDFVFSTLKDLQMLAEAVIAGEIQPHEAHVAVEVLNRILDTPLPYGWILYDLVFVGIGPWATVAAYYGSYWDMLGAICLSPVTVLTYRVCEKLKISHLEEILVPFNIGLVTPLVWRFCNGGQDLCHITPMYMGALVSLERTGKTLPEDVSYSYILFSSLLQLTSSSICLVQKLFGPLSKYYKALSFMEPRD